MFDPGYDVHELERGGVPRRVLGPPCRDRDDPSRGPPA